ncbi:MAG: DEAD/DEAH box helicase family protein [Betaproteobacteria bacterium]|nr:DEAD/DEAH box helicase family protein [Betaproteobacteria bacterium]MBI2294389.1 DEAD/DEAH box helicase family protein [Betaproteobacteria bacterium]MBI3055588.1 DEAD/DEAH box helicase family protein [Betaproteobacteria bacterium]
MNIDFEKCFQGLTGYEPFRWQIRLYRRLLKQDLPPAVELPTGLGKTSVMAIWLLARACNPTLPRRLVYVVDRRAVVDQATRVAEQLRDAMKQDDLLDIRQRLSLGNKPTPRRRPATSSAISSTPPPMWPSQPTRSTCTSIAAPTCPSSSLRDCCTPPSKCLGDIITRYA